MKGLFLQMNYPVTIQLKKQFLLWFQEIYTINHYDYDWFFEELIGDEQALFHLYFVDDIEYCPKGVIVDVVDGEQMNFRFFKDHVTTTDVYTAYHELQLYRHDSFYMKVKFHDGHRPKLYDKVIENELSYDCNIKETTDDLLQYLLEEGKDKFIKDEIDIALERRNMERFKQLTNWLQMKNN